MMSSRRRAPASSRRPRTRGGRRGSQNEATTRRSPVAARRRASGWVTIFSLVSIKGKTPNFLLQQVECGLRHSFRGDAGHAAVIDGAIAEQAGAATDGLTNDAGEGAGGSGGDVIGGAEDGDGGDAEGGGDMHGSGIVGEADEGGRGHFNELAERGFAGEIVGGDGEGIEVAVNHLADAALFGGTE